MRPRDEWLRHQFHSSSLCSRAPVLTDFTDGERESGTSTLPSPCGPSSSSNNDADARACDATGADAGVGDVESGESVAENGFDEIETELPDAGPGDASAENSDCETSESSTDARFWLFVNLPVELHIISTHTVREEREKGNGLRTSRPSAAPPTCARRCSRRSPSTTVRAGQLPCPYPGSQAAGGPSTS